TKKNGNKSGYVYFIGLTEYKDHVKIGFSSDNNFIRRQKSIETASPHDTFLIGYIQSDNCVSLENDLHKKYNDSRKKREWFSIKYTDIRKLIKEHGGVINDASH
ncbi:MAG: GIY-YIG nuclease family protein, partial [Candidatus Kapabacteria bacterium]|nr:GIY-YIG nuclease family protein [Candidatus Kapabacteria bacterium]